MQHLKRLQHRLIETRELLELVREREEVKKQQASLIADAFSRTLWPHAKAMRDTFNTIVRYVPSPNGLLPKPNLRLFEQ
jgi:hypothetical protein